MRQHLPDREAGVAAVRRVLTDPVVKREMSVLDALEDERCGEDFGQAIEMERGVGSGGREPFDILIAERVLPENVVAADNRGGHAWNARLGPQRFDVIGEPAENQVVDRVVGRGGRGGQQEYGDDQSRNEMAH